MYSKFGSSFILLDAKFSPIQQKRNICKHNLKRSACNEYCKQNLRKGEDAGQIGLKFLVINIWILERIHW